jgi:hypothetical protein
MALYGKCLGCDGITELTRHHVVPQEMVPKSKVLLAICKTCHTKIHRRFRNTELHEMGNKIITWLVFECRRYEPPVVHRKVKKIINTSKATPKEIYESNLRAEEIFNAIP